MRHNRQWKREYDREVDVATTHFENLCSACDNFGDPERCPFYERAQADTFWKDELGCTKFED